MSRRSFSLGIAVPEVVRFACSRVDAAANLSAQDLEDSESEEEGVCTCLVMAFARARLQPDSTSFQALYK